MDHLYYIDKLSAYSDRELTGEEHEIIRQHVESCPECRAALIEYEKLDQLVENNQAMGDSDYWDSAAERIEARLSSETDAKVIDVSRRRTGWLGWKLASVAATLAVLTFVALNREDIERKVLQGPTSKPSLQESPADRKGKKADIVSALSEREEPEGEAQSDLPDTDAGFSDDDLLRTAQPSVEAVTGETGETGRVRLKAKAPLSAPVVVRKASPPGGEGKAESMDAGIDRRGRGKDQSRAAIGKNEAEEVTITRVTRVPATSIDKFRITGRAQLTDSAPIVDESVAQTSQEHWRQLRDSLEGDLRTRYYSRAESEKAARFKSLSSAGSEAFPFLHSAALLRAYYRVGYLTEDRKEFERSLKYIRQYLKQPELPYRSKAAGWLEELEGLESVKFEDE